MAIPVDEEDDFFPESLQKKEIAKVTRLIPGTYLHVSVCGVSSVACRYPCEIAVWYRIRGKASAALWI
jgi:hypothetical protein